MINIVENFLITHKFYDEKNRRMSIFGKFNSANNKLKIYLVKCSKKDVFSRKLSRTKFAEYLEYREGDEVPDIHPVIYLVPSTPETYKNDFVHFCRENFMVKDTLKVTFCNKLIQVDVYSNSVKDIVKTDDSSLRMKSISDEYLKKLIAYEEEKNQKTEALYNTIQKANNSKLNQNPENN